MAAVRFQEHIEVEETPEEELEASIERDTGVRDRPVDASSADDTQGQAEDEPGAPEEHSATRWSDVAGVPEGAGDGAADPAGGGAQVATAAQRNPLLGILARSARQRALGRELRARFRADLRARTCTPPTYAELLARGQVPPSRVPPPPHDRTGLLRNGYV